MGVTTKLDFLVKKKLLEQKIECNTHAPGVSGRHALTDNPKTVVRTSYKTTLKGLEFLRRHYHLMKMLK